MKGKVFVVGLLFGVFEACGCTACKLVTLWMWQRRVCHVAITNNIHVNRHNTGGKHSQKCTERGGIRTAAKCGTDESVRRLCVASLLRVPRKDMAIGIGNIVLLSRQTQSPTVRHSVSHRQTLQVFSIPALQKTHSLLLQRVFTKKQKKTPPIISIDKIFVKTSPQVWIGRGHTNWPARSPDFSCSRVGISTVSQWAQYHDEVENTTPDN
jgi:hypothetical protein